MNTNKEIAALIDHTLLKPESTAAMVEQVCDEAITAGFCMFSCPIRCAVFGEYFALLAASDALPHSTKCATNRFWRSVNGLGFSAMFPSVSN